MLDIETEKTTVEKPLPTPPSKTVAEHITPPVDGALEQESESNTFTPIHIDLKNVKANTLSPKEQEAQGSFFIYLATWERRLI